MASPEPQADPPKKNKSRTVRIHVHLKEKAPGTIVCYADLLRQALKTKENNAHDQLPPDQEGASEKHSDHQSEDTFFQGLLARSAKYTLHDDHDDEDSVGNSTRKKLPDNEYDVEDPFIDDSDMLLDDSYAYSERKHDGFFVYQGPLDDDEEDKKKATAKKPTSSTTTSSSKKLSVKRKAVTDPSDQSHSETEGDGKSAKNVKKPTAKKPVTKGTPSTLQAKKRKLESAGDAISKDDSQKKKKPKLDDPTASPSKKSEPIKKKTTGETAKEEPKTEGVTTAPNGDASDKSSNVQNSEKDGGPTSHTASANAAATTSQQSSPAAVAEKPKKSASKPVKLLPLDPAVEKIIEKLREDVAKEDFAVKSKFPPTLRPTVLAAGVLVFRQSNGADDNFLNHLMGILPYNKFTLRKFLYKQVGPSRIEELQTEIDGMITVLKQQVDEAMPAQIKQHAELVAKMKEGEGQKPTPAEGAEATTDDNAKEDGEQAGSVTRFRFNEESRKTLYNIMKAEVARTTLKNDLNQLLKNNETLISETTARKQMYQRLMQCFPDGWMTTYDMSRQYSQYKVRQQKKEDKTASISSH